MNAFVVLAALFASAAAVPAYGGYGYGLAAPLAYSAGYAAQPYYSGYSSVYNKIGYSPVIAPVVTKSYAVAAPAIVTKSYAAPVLAAPALIGGYGLAKPAYGYGLGLGHY